MNFIMEKIIFVEIHYLKDFDLVTLCLYTERETDDLVWTGTRVPENMLPEIPVPG